MAESSSGGQERGEQHVPETSAKSQSKTGLILGTIAIALVLALSYLFLASMRRLDGEMARISQQAENLEQRVERSEEQSQKLARQASQAAADAQTAARERDAAKQAEANSAAQAQTALKQAAAAQRQANQAQQQAAAEQQKAAQYREQREAELAQLQQVLGQIAQTQRTALGLVVTLGSKSVRFDFDQSYIKPQYRDILNRIAGVLLTLKGYSISVYGYTDDIGTQAYNLKLSERRAEAVRDLLVQAGISPGIISTKGFGKSDPRVPGDSEQARAANRRVEIAIVDVALLPANRVALQK